MKHLLITMTFAAGMVLAAGSLAAQTPAQGPGSGKGAAM
jgi:hypothetical protein